VPSVCSADAGAANPNVAALAIAAGIAIRVVFIVNLLLRLSDDLLPPLQADDREI
jgi:hypothetical protein